MAGVLVDVMLPVLLVAVVGGWLGQRAGMQVAPLAQVTFEIFTPALVFTSLLDIDTPLDSATRVVAIVVIGFVAMGAAGVGLSRICRYDRPTVVAAALCAAVANLGNMGLPIARLAFGQKGLEIAVIAFVASSVLSFSGGVVIASMASGTIRAALGASLQVPTLWAGVAALAVNAADLSLPAPIMTSGDILAGAAIPAMLMVLGLQVVEGLRTLHKLREVAGTVVLRLCVGPLVTAGLATVSGLGGVTRSTLIVLGGMPTAVTATIIATRYDAQPIWVTQAVVASTLVSVVTVTVLVTVLR